MKQKTVSFGMYWDYLYKSSLFLEAQYSWRIMFTVCSCVRPSIIVYPVQNCFANRHKSRSSDTDDKHTVMV